MNWNQFQLVFHDIDGCLNPPDGEDFVPGEEAVLSQSQRETLQEISAKVDQSDIDTLIFNTGRSLSDTLYLLDAFPTEKLKYLLLEHSAYAYDVQKEKHINLGEMAHSMGMEEVGRSYQTLEELKVVMKWYRSEGQALVEKKLQVPMACLDKEANVSIEIPQGFAAETLLDALREEFEREFPDKKDDFYYCYSQTFVDVTGRIQKSDGAKVLSRYLQIPESDSVVVGDGMNDLDIFEKWSNLFCPSNAHHSIQDICKKRGGYVSEFNFGKASLELFQKCSSN